MAVVIGSRQGPGRALSTTHGAEIKTNPEACDPKNPQNPQNPQNADVPRCGRRVGFAIAWTCTEEC